MYTSDFWHKLNLLGKKVISLAILLSALLAIPNNVQAQQQKGTQINLPNYDEKWLHYGFIIGLHSSNYGLRYNEHFTTAQMDSVHSIVTPGSFGFSLGFIANFRIAQYLDFRILPKVSFYENRLEYNFTNGDPAIAENVESTFVEFPLLLKFKSQRRKNNRVYVVGGITPGIEATGKKEEGESEEKLLVKGGNLSFDIGFGIDIYYPLFKFSPEVRYSAGLLNMLKPEENKYSAGLDQVNTHTITFYFQFE